MYFLKLSKTFAFFQYVGDASERGEFLKYLWALRPEAPVFLAMLNDTRRQVRNLLQAHSSKHSAVQAYR